MWAKWVPWWQELAPGHCTAWAPGSWLRWFEAQRPSTCLTYLLHSNRASSGRWLLTPVCGRFSQHKRTITRIVEHELNQDMSFSSMVNGSTAFLLNTKCILKALSWLFHCGFNTVMFFPYPLKGNITQNRKKGKSYKSKHQFRNAMYFYVPLFRLLHLEIFLHQWKIYKELSLKKSLFLVYGSKLDIIPQYWKKKN